MARDIRLRGMIFAALAAAGCGQRVEGLGCMEVPRTGACAAPIDLKPSDLSPTKPNPSELYCKAAVVEILSTETPAVDPNAFFTESSEPGAGSGCCYDVVIHDRQPDCSMVIGRPFVQDSRPIAASAGSSANPVTSAWLAMAHGEHASVAAFAALTLDLMAHGAPTRLLRDVARALDDEVRHTELALGLAGRDGSPIGAFPFSAAVDPRRSLGDVAAAAVREGCIGETLSALVLRRAALLAEDARTREVLGAIADDEEQHAVLAWAIVAWAVRKGGSDVRAAVVTAFREPVRIAAVVDTDALLSAGLLGPRATADVVEEGLRDVVGPAQLMLLSA